MSFACRTWHRRCGPVALAAQVVLAEPGAAVRQAGESLTICAGGKPVATYVWNDPQILRPYLTRACTLPGGLHVTRNHPPVEGTDRH